MAFERWFNRTLNQVWGFIEDRSGMPKWALRPQPDFTFKPSYWTGAFVATAFLYQVISGALLLFYYQPITTPTYLACGQPAGSLSTSPGAWCSTYYIIHSVPMGSLLLSSHLYGAYAMIFLAFVHFYRGYYLGVYKKPREFS
jgi:quinol-cytochrome oxidoreductase complex cytochrome b subunit